MDYLSLYLTSRMLRLKPSVKRLITGAAAGAVYSVAAVAVNMPALPNAVMGTAVSVIVSLIARVMPDKGTRLKNYLIFSALLWGISAMLGGMMTAVYSVFNRAVPEESVLSVPNGIDKISAPYFFMLAAVSAAASIFIGRLFERRSNVKDVSVKIIINSAEAELRALVDSGNLLREPISGMAVIVVSYDCVSGIIPEAVLEYGMNIPEIDSDLKRRLRAVPVRGIEKNSVRWGIIPDSVIIEENGSSYSAEAVIVAERRGSCGYGGFGGTVPSLILR